MRKHAGIATETQNIEEVCSIILMYAKKLGSSTLLQSYPC